MLVAGLNRVPAAVSGLTAILLVTNALICASSAQAEDQKSPDIMQEINEGFRSAYSSALKEDLTASGPVMIVNSGKAVLLRSGKREEAHYIPDQYRILKTVDHVPLAIFVMLVNHTDKPLGASTTCAVGKMRDELSKAEKKVGGMGLTSEALDRVRGSLSGSRTFLGQVVSAGQVSHADLYSFTRQCSAALMDNAYDAVAMELGGLNDQVMAWKKDMSPAEWDSLHVVVMGGHMPRQQEREMQYFQKLLGEREEGVRIIYQEGSDDETSALDLLGKHLIDSAIGEAFFGDRMRMHRDLLADAAKRYLQEHDPNQPKAAEGKPDSK